MLRHRPKIRHAFLHRAAATFYDRVTSDNLWPVLRSTFPELARLIEHEDRATRSDLREGLGLVVWSCLARCDLKSFRVGWRQRYRSSDGRTFDFVGLRRELVAKWCELAESTVSRAWTLLRRASILAGPGRDGFNVIRQPVEECDVTPKTPAGRRALPCVRRFFESFFERLGLGAWLNQLRNPTPAAPSSPAPASSSTIRQVVEGLARALGPPAESG